MTDKERALHRKIFTVFLYFAVLIFMTLLFFHQRSGGMLPSLTVPKAEAVKGEAVRKAAVFKIRSAVFSYHGRGLKHPDEHPLAGRSLDVMT